MKHLFKSLALTIFGLLSALPAHSQAFAHPGGLHTAKDLERMKERVARRDSPWIEGWERLVADPLARADYRSGARPNFGDSRQRASADAHAAYLNFIRWYVGGDRSHADCAIRICNEWSAKVNQIPSGNDIPGLSGIPISEFAMVGELLRVCPFWEKSDQMRFQHMMREYFYPQVHGFLAERNRKADSHFWANWDIANLSALIAMGVYLDDRAMFDEGVEYFKHGRGTGSIMNAVYQIYPGGLGQWQESGRDQPHAQLGVGMLAQACEIAWNQGVDLYGFSENRLLAGAEYTARTALSLDVPYKFYNNSDEAKNHWLSSHTRGRFTAPVWELLHNHYVVRKGLKAPHVSALAALSRPEGGGGDHFGYGTLTFTLDAAASPYPPLPKPAAPLDLTARPALGRVHLSWKPAAGLDAAGFVVRRAPADGGEFETIGEWGNRTTPRFTDETAKPGVAYRYVVAARNQAGTSADSNVAITTTGAPAPFPPGWAVGRVAGPLPVSGKVEAVYCGDGGRTITLASSGGDIGGDRDDTAFVSFKASGDFVLVARVMDPPPDRISSSGFSKVGLMMRESNQPDARYAAVTLGEGGLRGTRARFRGETGARPKMERGNDYTWAPVWYKLQREGNTFTALHSDDGVNWFKVGSSDIAMPMDFLAGFVVCSSKPGQSATARFEDITAGPP